MTDFDSEFPPLHAGKRTPPNRAAKQADDEWELLTSEDDEIDRTETDDSYHLDISNDDDDDDDENVKPSAGRGGVIVQGNPKMLHHCASSPDLRCFDHTLDQDDGDVEDNKAEESSFAMVSTAASVVSVSSTRSFRDALFASPIVSEEKTANEEGTATTLPRNAAPRPYRKPKIVVAPPPSLMRRSSQSSPNLLGLIHEDDDEILGCTDAEEFYHRKAKGAQGRSNGMKLRPDEAKRKQYAVHKRAIQRQASLK